MFLRSLGTRLGCFHIHLCLLSLSPASHHCTAGWGGCWEQQGRQPDQEEGHSTGPAGGLQKHLRVLYPGHMSTTWCPWASHDITWASCEHHVMSHVNTWALHPLTVEDRLSPDFVLILLKFLFQVSWPSASYFNRVVDHVHATWSEQCLERHGDSWCCQSGTQPAAHSVNVLSLVYVSNVPN